MLVCPHCQFENPDTHKFCQKCGDSLTEMNCSVCGTTVPFEAEFCSHCGAATGIVWKAILSPATSTEVDESAVASPIASSPESASLELSAPNSKYLDAQQRYQLLDSVDLAAIISQASSAEVEVRVLDRYPLQASLLEALHNHADAKSTATNEQGLIPLVAQLYLELQERYPSLPLPQIHEAWEQDGIAVVLLEDRTHLPSLLEFWQDEQVLPLQILHWLHEMVELWEALEPSYCCQSLLVLENMRVDEDYLLCLQRLYSDDPHQLPRLGDLGRFWQALFQQSQRTQWGDLARLCCDLERGSVSSLSELRSRIEEIATGLQPALAAAPPIAAPTAAPELLNPFKMDDADEKNFFDETAAPAIAVPVSAAQLSIEPTAQPEETEPARAAGLDELEDILLKRAEKVEIEPMEEGPPDGDDSPTVVLPMRLVSLDDAGATDIGRQRDHNEDNFSIQTSIQKLEGMKGRSLQAKGLYILCDGMGGHAGGEVASALAVETLQRYFAEHWQDQLPSQDSIREAIRQANQAIYNSNQENARSGSGRMGTTLVLVLVQNTEAAIAHVGDSRLYSLSRRRGLERLTVDHEVGQREIQRGVEPTIAYARPDAYQLTQALGPRDENFVNPDIRFVELNEDMLLLLCSDGLTDNDLLEAYWQTHLEPLLSAQANLTQGVEQLIELANQQNGHDNITAIAIRAKVRPDLGQLNQK